MVDGRHSALVDRINLLRSKLGLGPRVEKYGDTVIQLEKELAVFDEQVSVRDFWLEKLNSDHGRLEALFALQFFSLIPLPVWSSRRDGGINSWNKYAEKAYNLSSSSILGSNFITLFVNEAERNQAVRDLDDITEGREGLQHFNMADDKDSSGMVVRVLTCCFAVFDPRLAEMTQAEISFDVRMLEQHAAELEEIQSNFKKEQTRRSRMLEVDREYALTALNSYCDRYVEFCTAKKRECHGQLKNPKLPSGARGQLEKSLSEWTSRLDDFRGWSRSIKARLEDCATQEQLQEVRVEIDRMKEDNV